MTRTGKCSACFSSVSIPFGQGVQNFLSASHCLLMTGGVKWRKLGIFMSSALANFPGAARFGLTKPCRRGSGTDAGWKLLGPGHTAPQSWSTGICWKRGGGTSGCLKRRRAVNVPALTFFKSRTRNSSKKRKTSLGKVRHDTAWWLYHERHLRH